MKNWGKAEAPPESWPTRSNQAIPETVIAIVYFSLEGWSWNQLVKLLFLWNPLTKIKRKPLLTLLQYFRSQLLKVNLNRSCTKYTIVTILIYDFIDFQEWCLELCNYVVRIFKIAFKPSQMRCFLDINFRSNVRKQLMGVHHKLWSTKYNIVIIYVWLVFKVPNLKSKSTRQKYFFCPILLFTNFILFFDPT
jgi:hypothetical protein